MNGVEEGLWQKNASIGWKTTWMKRLLDLFVRKPLLRGEILDDS